MPVDSLPAVGRSAVDAGVVQSPCGGSISVTGAAAGRVVSTSPAVCCTVAAGAATVITARVVVMVFPPAILRPGHPVPTGEGRGRREFPLVPANPPKPEHGEVSCRVTGFVPSACKIFVGAATLGVRRGLGRGGLRRSTRLGTGAVIIGRRT